jgi:hypothetical protein
VHHRFRVSLTRVANVKNLQSEEFILFCFTPLIPVSAPCLCEYLREFSKIRNDPKVIFRGLGEDDS